MSDMGIFRQLARSAKTPHVVVPRNVVTRHPAIRFGFSKTMKNGVRSSWTPRIHFRGDKPLHENAGQIGMSFEQIGAVTILEALDWRSNILICCRNRPGVTEKMDL